MGGGRIQGKIVLRKSVLIFLTVFADEFGPPEEWIWSPGWEGSDPRENSVKKISTHFLNGICGWIWTLEEWIWSPGWEGVGSRGKSC